MYLLLPLRQSKTTKAAALALAEAGLPVLPCEPNGKRPLLKNWPERATTDPATIRDWWRRRPDANLGVLTGDDASRLLVLDVDGEQGEASLRALGSEIACGFTCGLPYVLTPRGGFHHYTLAPPDREIPGNSCGKLGPGLDIRGKGGFVVVPPSVIDGRPYVWGGADLVVKCPDELLDRLEQQERPGTGRAPDEWAALVTNGVDQGTRNSTIASLAGLLFRYLPPSHAELAAELVACWNAQRCRPPLEAAELRRTLDSIAAREIARRGLL